MKRFTEKQVAEFERLSKMLIKFLNENCHPHVSVIVTPTTSELLEGAVVVNTTEFCVD